MSSTHTEETRQVVAWAEEEARAMRHTEVGTHHYLIALVRAGAFPGDERSARLAVREATYELQPRTDEPLDVIPPSFGTKQLLERAAGLAGDDPITPDHLAAAIKRQSGHVVSVLHRMGIFLY